MLLDAGAALSCSQALLPAALAEPQLRLPRQAVGALGCEAAAALTAAAGGLLLPEPRFNGVDDVLEARAGAFAALGG